MPTVDDSVATPFQSNKFSRVRNGENAQAKTQRKIDYTFERKMNGANKVALRMLYIHGCLYTCHLSVYNIGEMVMCDVGFQRKPMAAAAVIECC